MFTKRGVSPVIATVLLVILTLVAVSILAVFVINFVNNSFNGSEECYKVLGKVKFENTQYSCNVAGATPEDGRTGFSIRIDSDQALALKVSLTSNGAADSYPIENESTSEKIRMLDGNFGGALEVPSRGGIRTYVATGAYQKAEVSAVLKSGIICDTRQSIIIDSCSDPAVKTKLNQY